MTVEEILRPAILEEFQRYERSGYQIKLRSVGKRRTKYTLISLAVALVSLCTGPLAILVWIITGIVYGNLMKKTDNVNTVIYVAKQFPDMPIDQIIAQEMIR